MPVYYVHSEGEVGFGEGFAQRAEGSYVEFLAGDYGEVQIGIGFWRAVYAGAESPHLGTRHMF